MAGLSLVDAKRVHFPSPWERAPEKFTLSNSHFALPRSVCGIKTGKGLGCSVGPRYFERAKPETTPRCLFGSDIENVILHVCCGNAEKLGLYPCQLI